MEVYKVAVAITLQYATARCLPVGLYIGLVFLAGCVTTNATMLGTASVHRSAITNVAMVKLYRTADQVPGKYEENALLHSKGNYASTNEPQMYESMRKKAAEMGANGVVLDAISEPSAGAKVAGAFLGVPADRMGKAIAIYVYPSGTVPVAAVVP